MHILSYLKMLSYLFGPLIKIVGFACKPMVYRMEVQERNIEYTDGGREQTDGAHTTVDQYMFKCVN
jgi:hypothetical protein